MKFSVLALSTLLALAAADSTITADVTASTISPEASCTAKNCNGSTKDRCCVASCYKVPCPSEGQARDTNSCVSACPQGTGSPADSRRYADCEQDCYSSHFFPADHRAGATSTESASGATATVRHNSATATGSGSGASASHGNSTKPATGDKHPGHPATGAKHTTNAASHFKLGASAAGLAGLVVAVFAL